MLTPIRILRTIGLVGLLSIFPLSIAIAIAGCGSSSQSTSSRGAGVPRVAHLAPPSLTPLAYGLKGVNGVEVSLYTSGLPDVSDLAFDAQGQLWATATNDPLGGAKPPPLGNGVYLIEQGQPSIKVISTVKLPIGLAWYRDKLYVANYGYVEMYWRFNGHSFADHKVILNHLAAGESGWADNPTPGPDGRLYMENAAGCDACEPSGHLEADLLSFKPDGSDVQIFATRIRGNTFSEFMPGTDDLFGVMNQQNAILPAPDDQFGMIRQGSDWGFPTCYGQGGSACHGIAQATAYLPQHNGSAGMALVDGQFGPAWGTSAFVTSVTTGTVDRIGLIKQSGSYAATGVYEFLTGLKAGDAIVMTPGQPSLLVGDYATGNIYQVYFPTGEALGRNATIPVEVPRTVTGTVPATKAAQSKTKPAPAPAAATGAVTIDAAPTGALMFTQKMITAKAGAVTIHFVNKSPVGHDVVVAQGTKVLGQTPVITKSTATLKLTLKPGDYVFYCSVPGHRAAGMQGTLMVTS
jgi:glucose/arabinose dehydrogenase/plastocyanin